ncbi:MAG: phosphate ABC transporter permease PstA, partial [Halomonas sp.]|nr:phosphate ABC transporter permease PstA [Halomonas sp.]
MSQSFDEISAQLRRRHRRSARLKWLSLGALGLALAFLVVFFADMLSKGLPAFQQAQLLVEVDYSEQASQMPPAAIDEEVRDLVSRGWLRTVPRLMRDQPELLGTTRSEWVLADGQVDQYLKGHANRLRDDARERVDRLVQEGRAELKFNTTFFTRGDSKMPELAGIMAAAIGTVMTMLVTLAVAFPIGVMTAVYLEEFAPDNRFTQVIEININNLAAIPSILFGLLGLAIFIQFFGMPRSSPLVGGMTLALMTLPIIIIATRTALRSVPDSIRHAAFGVGCSRWQVVRDHVLPLAMPGIMTGSIIGLAQAMGETAPLIIVGMVAFIPDVGASITNAATVLPAQIFTWAGEPDRAFIEKTAGGILVLLSVLIFLNATAVILRKKFERRWYARY